MKKIESLLSLIFVLGVLNLSAQLQPYPKNLGCGVNIWSEFDSECLITGYSIIKPPKSNPAGMAILNHGLDLLSRTYNADCLKACKNNTVNYHAECVSGYSYSWTVTGGVIQSIYDDEKSISVQWGNGNSGTVSVSVLTTDRNYCSTSICIELLNSPTVASTTIPVYFVENDRKWIEICMNETVAFMDASLPGTTPITGYFWRITGGENGTDITSGNPNFIFSPDAPGDYYVEHKVQNECGCESKEEYHIKVSDGYSRLELSCYGMVCQGAVETYTALSPYCEPYNWHVEGGTIVEGQGKQTITIQWGAPTCGYGIISLDQSKCAESGCKNLSSVRIPILTNHAEIIGHNELCVDEEQLYELPLWGATQYRWNVSPSSGVQVNGYHHDNQRLITFSSPGNYTINVEYECDFIGCGPFMAISKPVTVKPILTFTASQYGEICQGNSVTFTANTQQAVTWQVYRNNTLLLPPPPNANTLNYTFTLPGSYTVKASNSAFCDATEYVVNVKAKPAAPVVTGEHFVCQGGSIGLSATPENNNYSIHWVPVCYPLYNSRYDDCVDATFSYTNTDTICSIYVYQQERETGCMSDTTLFSLEQFRLIDAPTELTACTGIPLVIDYLAQSLVLYEWSMQPTGFGSIVGERHDTSSVVIMFNNTSGPLPNPAYLILKRISCGATKTNTIPITVHQVNTPTITISPNPACVGDMVTFTSSDPNCSEWIIKNMPPLSGTTVSCIFSTSGEFDVKLRYPCNTYCEPSREIATTVTINPLPNTTILSDILNGQIKLEAPANLNYSYNWSPNSPPPVTNPYILVSPPTNNPETYSCTITDVNGCQAIGDYTLLPPDGGPGPSCTPIVPQLTGCNTYTVSVSNPPPQGLSWHVSPYSGYTILSSNPATITITFTEVNDYTITASALGFCETARVRIDYVPKFVLDYDACVDSLIIDDQTVYYGNPPTHTYTFSDLSMQPISIPPGQKKKIALNGIENTVLVVTLNNEICLPPLSIPIPFKPRIDAIIAPDTICDGTPFQVSASCFGITRYNWQFSDGTMTSEIAPYHIFTTTANSTTTSYISFSGANEKGCVVHFSSNKEVVVSPNPLSSILLSVWPPFPAIFCQGAGMKELSCYGFAPDVDEYLLNYRWLPDSPRGVIGEEPFIYNALTTGYFSVKITNSKGCIRQLQESITFLTTPRVHITGKTVYCQNDTVKLAGGNSSYTRWRVQGPNNYLYQASNSANLKFKPPTAGNYIVTLTVRNNDCQASDTVTVTVHAQPHTPILGFVLGHECVHEPPVLIHDVNPNNNNVNNLNLYWSNGFFASVAEYYSDGWATAYYMDIVSGCKSGKDSIFIEPAPNFDALLTGCYEICERWIKERPWLYIFGFAPFISNYDWRWFYEGQETQHGSETSAGLHLDGYGRYEMEASYNGGLCNATSPELALEPKKICPCEDLSIIDRSIRYKCEVEGCKLIYNVEVTICNNGNTTFHADHFYTNSAHIIMSWYPQSLTINPGRCETFTFSIEITDFYAHLAEFILYDRRQDCEFRFSIPIDWKECIRCRRKFEELRIDFSPSMSTEHQASYFEFYAPLPGNVTDVLAMWCEPPLILDYTVNLPYAVKGIFLFDYGVLSQMAANDEMVCIYAIICIKDELCLFEYCIPARELLDRIRRPSKNVIHYERKEQTPTQPQPKMEDLKLYLAPNPTYDNVTVMGIDEASIKQITVLTAELRQVATHKNTNQFNVSNVTAGSYIIKVVTQSNEVIYLKLIKQ